ncbi:MAG: hypothetical protein Q9208_006870 [Pyrenodesmia sp. 3 TL-2023]
MGRELQKKKNRSSNPKVKQKPKSKKLNLKSNPIVAANWSIPYHSPPIPSFFQRPSTDAECASRKQSQTLSQNYRRLGLVSRLNARTGGVEKHAASTAADLAEKNDRLAIANLNPTTLVPGTVRIERDQETGAIVRVLGGGDGEGEGEGEREGRREWNGRVLVDELNDGEDEEEENRTMRQQQQHDLPLSVMQGAGGDREGRGVVPELMAQAAKGGGKKRPRKQSQREEEWVERLVGAYGDDVGRMARDRKLNPLQQSEGDIGRRVRLWKEGRRRVGEDVEVGG